MRHCNDKWKTWLAGGLAARPVGAFLCLSLGLYSSCSRPDPQKAGEDTSREDNSSSSQEDDDNEDTSAPTESESMSSSSKSSSDNKTSKEDTKDKTDKSTESKEEEDSDPADSTDSTKSTDPTDSGDASTGDNTSSSTGDDNNSSSEEDPKPAGIFVTPNVDDDNGNGKADFQDPYFEKDNDIALWELPTFPKDAEIEIRLSGALKALRIWKEGKDWMGAGEGKVKASFRFVSDGSPLSLQVEMGAMNAKVKAVLKNTSDASSSSSSEYKIQSSPLIFNHHLMPTRQSMIVSVLRDIHNGPANNSAFRSGFKNAVGDSLKIIQGSRYQHDVWIQDEVDFGVLTGSNGARIDVVLDSIRDRGLKTFAQNEITGAKGRKANWVRGVWGQGSRPTDGDSFGNVEASPPVTVDGVHYPFGRIYYGGVGRKTKINDALAKFFQQQEIQKPFSIDTSWLCIGHVDEIATFIPDTSAPRGFRFVYADVKAGYKLLESASGQTRLDRYRGSHNYPTIASITQDRALRRYNEDLQSDYLDPILRVFKKELDLKDEEIILFPSLFHRYEGECAAHGRAASLIPGTVNMAVLGDPAKETILVMPDPFLRPSSASQSSDPLIQATKKLFPKEHKLHFIDDWYTYHMLTGEVHCGSNAIRSPKANWWDFVK